MQNDSRHDSGTPNDILMSIASQTELAIVKSEAEQMPNSLTVPSRLCRR